MSASRGSASPRPRHARLVAALLRLRVAAGGPLTPAPSLESLSTALETARRGVLTCPEGESTVQGAGEALHPCHVANAGGRAARARNAAPQPRAAQRASMARSHPLRRRWGQRPQSFGVRGEALTRVFMTIKTHLATRYRGARNEHIRRMYKCALAGFCLGLEALPFRSFRGFAIRPGVSTRGADRRSGLSPGAASDRGLCAGRPVPRRLGRAPSA